MKKPVSVDAIYDPVLRQKKAADYLGISVKQIRRFDIERQPIPSTGGRPTFGYRLSVLNAVLDRLRDPKSRAPIVKKKAS